MAYDPTLAHRLREALAARTGITERKMFGGLTFLLNGHMCCGLVGDDLVVRTSADDHAAALAEPHARAMDFTGRSLTGFVYVGREGTDSDADLLRWVERAVGFVGGFPPKGAA